MERRIGEEIHVWQEVKPRRSDQERGCLKRRILELLRLRRELGFVFGFLSGGNGPADWTGMFAVEGFFQRLRQGIRVKIIGQHGRPGDGLQRGPMPARRREQRENHQPVAEPGEHDGIVRLGPLEVKAGCVAVDIRRFRLHDGLGFSPTTVMKLSNWFGLAAPVLLAGMVLSCADVRHVAPVSGTNGVATTVHLLNAPGITNFYQLTDHIYSGSAPEGEAGFAALKELGIQTIISVDGAKPDVELAKRYGLRYVHLPIGYDGVPTEQGNRLAKAAVTLPGPIYIHCHHGLHRGPSAAAVACMATAGWTPQQALAWLDLAGTSTNYPGLFKTVAAFQPPSPKVLKKTSGKFPEISPISPLADVMVDIDGRVDNLKLIQKSGYHTPTTHPDLDPANEAMLLNEQFKELLRSPLMEQRNDDFRTRLTNAEEAANTFHLSLLITPFDATRADAAFQRVNDSCAACHVKYRNPSR